MIFNKRERITPIVITLYLVSFWLTGLIESSIFLLTLGAVVASLYAPNSKQTSWPWPDVAVLGYALSLILAVNYSGHVQLSMVQTAPFVPALLLYLLLTRFQFDAPGYSLVCSGLNILAIFVAATIIVGGWVYTWNPEQLPKHLPTSVLVVPNDVLLLSCCMPFILVSALRAPLGWRKMALLIALVLCLMAMVILNSRASLLVSLLGTLVVIVFIRERRWLWAMAAGISAVVLADAVRGFTLLTKFTENSLLCERRLPLWGAAVRLWLERPLLGHGVHNFQGLYRSHVDSFGLPACALADKRLTPWPHNLFLEVMLSQGLLGASFIILLVGWALIRLYRLSCAHSSPAQMQAVALLAAWVTFGAAAIVELTFLRYWVVIIFSTLLGLTVAIEGVENFQRE